jgi:hypothetical protein
MPTIITPKRLRSAARQALELDELLDNAMRQKLMPLLIGYDLDHLSQEFEQAAVRLQKARTNA